MRGSARTNAVRGTTAAAAGKARPSPPLFLRMPLPSQFRSRYCVRGVLRMHSSPVKFLRRESNRGGIVRCFFLRGAEAAPSPPPPALRQSVQRLRFLDFFPSSLPKEGPPFRTEPFPEPPSIPRAPSPRAVSAPERPRGNHRRPSPAPTPHPRPSPSPSPSSSAPDASQRLPQPHVTQRVQPPRRVRTRP